MEIKIDGYLQLNIKKRGKWLIQKCPYSIGVTCTEHCPLMHVDELNNKLILCQNTFTYSELIKEGDVH